MYFLNRRPRGFHYTYRFSSEQRDILDDLRRGVPPSEVARKSLNGAADARRESASRRLKASPLLCWIIVIAVLLLVAIAII